MSYKLMKRGVKRLADGACIPPMMDNMDWRRYQEWLAAGNTPDPVDPDPAPIDLSDINNLDKVLKTLGLVMRDYCNQLKAGTYTNKSVAELRTDFMTKYQSLP